VKGERKREKGEGRRRSSGKASLPCKVGPEGGGEEGGGKKGRGGEHQRLPHLLPGVRKKKGKGKKKEDRNHEGYVPQSQYGDPRVGKEKGKKKEGKGKGVRDRNALIGRPIPY